MSAASEPNAGVPSPWGGIAGDQGPGPEVMETEPPLAAALEAVLLVADAPVTSQQLSALTGADQVVVEECLQGLAGAYREDGRGFELRDIAGGWRYYTAPGCAAVVERFLRDGQQARLTQAALETLAVVAYRQPVSRGRISAIRGVNCDGVIRTLVSRGLVDEAGSDELSGATLYRTSSYFLERLGLRSVADLPPIAPYLPDIDTLDSI